VDLVAKDQNLKLGGMSVVVVGTAKEESKRKDVFLELLFQEVEIKSE
jgi:hypothetical protein